MSLDMLERWHADEPAYKEIFLRAELESKEKELAWANDYARRLEIRILELHARLAELTEEYKQLLKSK